jgi:hypothetical protein
MRRAVLAAALLLCPLTSGAEGLLLGVSIGPGISVGPLSWTGPSASFAGPGQPMPEPRELTLAKVAAYATLSVDARLGIPVSREVLAGVEGEATLLGGGPTLGYTSYDVGLTVAGAAVATWRRPGRRLILSAGAGVALSKFSGGRLAIGAEDNIAEYEDVFGPMVKAAVGWMLTPMTRAELEARVAAQWSEHLVHVPLAVTFRLRAGLL